MNNRRNKLLTASIVVTIIGLAGKFFGFARDAVIAAYYGADWQTDAFFFSQSMPGIIFPAVCNSLSTAFLTCYVSKQVNDKEQADIYGSKIITFSSAIAIMLSFIAIAIVPVLVPVFAPGFSSNQTTLAVHLSRITMAAFVLTMGQYMFGAILSAKKMFYGAQIAALIYNFSVIVATVFLGKRESMDALTYTVVIGHLIQLIVLVSIAKRHFKYSFVSSIFDSETRSLLSLTLPILLGNSIVQINNIVDKVLSSLFGEGAMSALSYSNTLNRFVTGVVITTLSTVIYPVLAEHYSKKNTKEFCETVRTSISLGMIVLLPISIITTLCANDIVKIVYERGSFDAGATLSTAYALSFYGMMYVFSAIQEVAVRAFYGMKDTKTPLRAAAVAIISNAIISYVLSVPLDMGLGGVALGSTISTLFAAVLLLIALKRRLPEINMYKLKNSTVKVLASSIVLSFAIIILRNCFSGYAPFIRFVLITAIGFVIHFSVLCILKCEELETAKVSLGTLIGKFKK